VVPGGGKYRRDLLETAATQQLESGAEVPEPRYRRVDGRCRALTPTFESDPAMDEAYRTLPEHCNCCPYCGTAVDISPSESSGDTPCLQCQQLLWFVRKSIDGVAVLTFLPGLMVGSESGGKVEEVFASLGDAHRVVVNFSRLRLASSLFLGMMIALRRKVKAVGGDVKVCELAPVVESSFRATQLQSLFEIYPDEQAAVNSFFEVLDE
jgi:anti-anti-sigma factor